MKKKEVIFIAGILVLAGILWLGFQITGKRSHNTIRITVDGKEFGTYSLSQDQVIHIGDTNVCEIKDGKFTSYVLTPEQFAEGARKVTARQVMEAARIYALDTVFTLSPEEVE